MLASADIDAQELGALDAAMANCCTVAPRREIVTEGAAPDEQLLLLEGWAFRVHLMADGRRQIIQFLLPGDLIVGFAGLPASASVVALTPSVVCHAPAPRGVETGLAQAYAAARALDQRYLFRQVTRLGRLSAYERLLDWFCEIHERLSRVGICSADTMTPPISQEVIADALGLTAVHVNRTLQVLRRDGVIKTTGRTVRLLNPAGCSSIVEKRASRSAWRL
ncbi:Crp/Fnr family transcriptional regulator [Sphingomonas panacis]|nr:Crp/Fnr family transcriptional regulator [Sphingomonas panacis]